MAVLLDRLRNYFDAATWPNTVNEAEQYLVAPMGGDNGEWNLIARAREDERQLMFYSICPLDVPPGRLTEMARYLTMANFGMLIGNFELDLSDGEIRYKTSIDLGAAEPTDDLLNPLVIANLTTMDKYLPGIDAVSLGGTAEEAIAAVEPPDH